MHISFLCIVTLYIDLSQKFTQDVTLHIILNQISEVIIQFTNWTHNKMIRKADHDQIQYNCVAYQIIVEHNVSKCAIRYTCCFCLAHTRL